MLDELQIHATYNVGKFWLAKRIIFLHLVVCTFFWYEKKKNNNCSCSCICKECTFYLIRPINSKYLLTKYYFTIAVYTFLPCLKKLYTLIPKVVLKNYKCKIKPLMFWCQKIKLSWHHQIRIDFSKALQQLSYLVYMAEFNCFLNGSIMT